MGLSIADAPLLTYACVCSGPGGRGPVIPSDDRRPVQQSSLFHFCTSFYISLSSPRRIWLVPFPSTPYPLVMFDFSHGYALFCYLV